MTMMMLASADPAHRLHCRLAALNSARLTPTLPADDAPGDFTSLLEEEAAFLNAARVRAAATASLAPTGAKAFLGWFESLVHDGPGQGDALFPWLARECSLSQMRWFLAQEMAGEAGFDDLTALTLLGMPARPKLELAKNFWDEMGRGAAKGMHGCMLQALGQHLDLALPRRDVVWQALALANTMTGLAAARRYAFHSVGALGVVELTAPGRAAQVNAGLSRLGVPARFRHYFALHAVLDVKHSAAWNAEVIAPLVEEDPRRATAIAEGALMRLHCGAGCFLRYREEFGLPHEGDI